MNELKDGEITIHQTVEDNKITVKLAANQYKFNHIAPFKSFLAPGYAFLKGEVHTENEENLVIAYEKTDIGISLSDYIQKMDELERMKLAHRLKFLVDFYQKPVTPFIHPDNLFIVGDTIKIGHRGLLNMVMPYMPEEETFLKQYKALIAYVLQPKLNFETILEGLGAVRNVLIEQIQKSETFEKIDEILSEQITLLSRKREAENKWVKRSRYLFYRWATFLLMLTTIGCLTGLFIYIGKVVPKQERMIEADAGFISNNYAVAIEALKEDDPKTLPKSAQYILAESYIRLDNLTNEQKSAVLNTLSQKSNENLLLFWIYTGRGKFEEALSIAKNIGDNQYILHAYTKLYDSVKANTEMDGTEKEKLLTEYEEEIQKYLELLGGKERNGESNDSPNEKGNN